MKGVFEAYADPLIRAPHYSCANWAYGADADSYTITFRMPSQIVVYQTPFCREIMYCNGSGAIRESKFANYRNLMSFGSPFNVQPLRILLRARLHSLIR